MTNEFYEEWARELSNEFYEDRLSACLPRQGRTIHNTYLIQQYNTIRIIQQYGQAGHPSSSIQYSHSPWPYLGPCLHPACIERGKDAERLLVHGGDVEALHLRRGGEGRLGVGLDHHARKRWLRGTLEESGRR